ncbi:MAG: 4Fe-4S dicluster domain-containing protein [Anaerolineae bacterium]|nr:4Fe-4S dicluster domain-containing protein [Anaerolineae bacterium]
MTTRGTVLVIDDELGIREGCKRALTSQGFTVDVARDGLEGLEKIKADGYDVILLDIMMPGIGGIELLSLIREHDPHAVCIIITGYGTVQLAVNAIKRGAYDFLTKPFTVDDLLLAVTHGLEHRRLLLEEQRLKELEAQTQQLIYEKRKMEEVEKAKAAFIRLVTHELQAPIAAIQGYLQLILDGYVEPEKQRELLEKAATRAQEQMALIADLLTLSKLRDARQREQATEVRLDELLRQVLEPFQAQAAEKGVLLRTDIEGNIPPVHGIPGEFKSLWTNLVSNAIKYTPSGGAIAISLRTDDGKIVGRVSDTGIGIPPEARDRLFTEFFRADNAKALALRGTGLGLVIVKQAVENAGGQIWVESELGRGTTFTFTIPITAAIETRPEPVSIEIKKGGRMSLRIIEKSALPEFVGSVMRQYQVMGPQAKEVLPNGKTQFAFGPITDPHQLRLDYDTTVLPPKKYLLPQEEVLFPFQPESLTATPQFDTQPRILFGVHTCDIHAMALLDAVFATGQRDEHYLKRRASTLIVGIECLAPCDEHSFCKSMGTLTADKGYDLHLIDLGHSYAVEVGTAAGEALLSTHATARMAGENDIELLNRVLSEKWPRFPYRLDFDGSELPNLMALSYKDPIWEELGKRCLSCAACNLVCPTCYCFNVVDHVTLDRKSGERIRKWDSCQLDEFARVATGENFRHKRSQRQRHRFFRKGKYIPEMHGELGCVGCGRCARACLVDITPVGVWNALYQAHAS